MASYLLSTRAKQAILGDIGQKIFEKWPHVYSLPKLENMPPTFG